MKEFLQEMLEKLPEGTVAQLHSYVPLGAEKAVTVISFSDSEADAQRASESIQRAAQSDNEKRLSQARNSFLSEIRLDKNS